MLTRIIPIYCIPLIHNSLVMYSSAMIVTVVPVSVHHSAPVGYWEHDGCPRGCRHGAHRLRLASAGWWVHLYWHLSHKRFFHRNSNSALLQLHLHSRLNTWLQWIAQRRDKKHMSFGIGAPCIKDLMVPLLCRKLFKLMYNNNLFL